MSTFHYEAFDSDGRLVTGELETESVSKAIEELQSRGLQVQSVGVATDPATESSKRQQQPVVSPPPMDGESVEQSVLRSHMAIILERGRAIAPALKAYAEEIPSGLQRRQLLSVCDILDRRDPSAAATALSELPECWIPLLGAATSSADPGHVLHEFLAESQRANELRQKWWLALAYPLILAALATIVMTALSILVIPIFRQVFSEFGLDLPRFTLWTLEVTAFLKSWGIVLIGILGALLLLVVLKAYRLLPASTFAWFGDRFIPPFGRRTAVARFARFMAELLEAGVSIPDALRIAGFTVNQSRIQRAAWRMANEIETTGKCSQPAWRHPLTATVAYALASDRPTSSRVRLLRDISSCYAERIRSGLSWATGFVEPLAIVVVGAAIAWTVVALYLPLVKLVEGLSK